MYSVHEATPQPNWGIWLYPSFSFCASSVAAGAMQVVCDPAGRVAQADSTWPGTGCWYIPTPSNIFQEQGSPLVSVTAVVLVLAALRHVMESGLGPRRPTAGLGEEEKGSHAECSSAKWHCLCCGAEMNSNGWWQCIRMPKYLVIISCEE